MLNPSSFTSHLSPGQTPPTVVNLKGGTTTLEVTEKTKTRLYFGTSVPGLRPTQPSIPSQYASAQFQERNITSTEPSYCNLNQGMLTPSSNNPHSSACTHTDTLSSDASLSSISSDGMQFTIHHRPCEGTTSTLMTAPPSHNQNSQLPPISQFAQTTEHLFPHSRQSSGLRPDSQNPFLSRGFTRSNSTPSNPAPYPQATGTSSESQQLTHFPQYMMNPLSHQDSHEQQQLAPQSNSLVSPLHSQELSMPSTQALSVRPALDINNPSTSTVNRHDPAKKSPQQLQAVAKTVSNALVPALKTDLSSTVKETMPILLREQLETNLSDAVRSMMPDILREQLKSEVTDAVTAIMPAIKEQMSQVASSLITTAISEFQRAVSDSATSIMETQLEAGKEQFLDESRKVINELTVQQASAFEGVFSEFKEQQEITEAATNVIAQKVLV